MSKRSTSFSKLPNSIKQPGPKGPPLEVVPCEIVEMDLVVPMGEAFGPALARELALKGMTGGYVRIKDIPISALEYLIVATASDEDHVAWYSDRQHPSMPGRIVDAAINCGTLDGKPFFHCHGIVKDAEGTELIGHFLVETFVPLQAVPAKVLGIKSARFERSLDGETHFDLFKPKAVAPAPAPEDANGLLVRVGPNVEIGDAIKECCQNAGWTRASVEGVGSLIGAHFSDGRQADSLATEYVITKGSVDLDRVDIPVDLNIVLVGFGGKQTGGQLRTGCNPVLITTELVIKRK